MNTDKQKTKAEKNESFLKTNISELIAFAVVVFFGAAVFYLMSVVF